VTLTIEKIDDDDEAASLAMVLFERPYFIGLTQLLDIG